MKRQHLLLPALALLLHPLQTQAQIPFTYQGKLENSSSPFTGTVTLRLGLFSVVTGSSALRTETLANVSVANGIFSVTPATFTAADFPGTARWLQIEVSNDGGITYTMLSPRQRITHTPYAIYATQAGTAATVSGTVPTSQISGSLGADRLSTGTTTGTIHFNPAGGAPFSVGNAILIPNLNTDYIDGLDSTAFLRTLGGTLTGNLGLQNPAVINFGTTTRQMLNLWSSQYGIGVQTDSLYQRSNNDFSWFRGGIHSNFRNAAGTDGTEVMRLTGNHLWLNPNSDLEMLSNPPRLAFGDLNSDNFLPYVSVGEAPDLVDTLQLTVSNVLITSNDPGTLPAISFGQTTGQHLVLFKSSADTYGIGVQGDTQYFRTGEQFAWYKDGRHSNVANDPGTDGTTLMTLSGTGRLTARGPENGLAMVNRNNSAQEWVLYSRNSGPTGQFAIWNSTNFSDVAAFSPNGDLYLVGELSTTVLTIRGGADVAEPFEMTKPEDMEPGSVVVIDEDLPGQLKLSTESYDNKVAGIISGAGGVQPGLRLHQDGVMEGDHHVALSGRVYVKADASFGKIKPGDLLTTSSTPGHAMKVKENDKAQGAILGKAMSRLDEGTGLVLVLVTLQ